MVKRSKWWNGVLWRIWEMCINTKYDEESPFWLWMEKNFVFQFQRTQQYGGWDLFKSSWDAAAGKWGAPVNLGLPINDADDNCSSFHGRRALRVHFGFDERRIRWPRYIQNWIQRYFFDHPFRTLITGNVSSSSGSRIELTKVTLTNKVDQSVMVYKTKYCH